MRQINPIGQMGVLAENPIENKAKQAAFLERGRKAQSEMEFYQLHAGDEPCGAIIQALPMEANAWNKNARAYYAYQCSLGRENLPMLFWKKIESMVEWPMWRARYKMNGQKHEQILCAKTKYAARKILDGIIPLAASTVSGIEPYDPA